MRSALLDLTPVIPVTACHQRNYVETYSRYSALKLKLRQPAAHGRRWQQRTPAIAAGLTDHIWSLEELLSYCLPPPRG